MIVARSEGKRKQNFILDQYGNIQFLLIGKKVPGVILQFLLCQVTVAIDKFQQTTHLDRVVDRLEAALTAQGQDTIHLHQ